MNKFDMEGYREVNVVINQNPIDGGFEIIWTTEQSNNLFVFYVNKDSLVFHVHEWEDKVETRIQVFELPVPEEIAKPIMKAIKSFKEMTDKNV